MSTRSSIPGAVGPIHISELSSDGFRNGFLHLAVLNAFFVAQPIFGKFSGNLQYLRHENFSAASFLTAAGLLFFVIPVALYVVFRFAARVRGLTVALRIYRVLLFVYGLLGCLLFGRWLSAEFDFLKLGLSDLIILLLAIPVAGLLPRLYFRHSSVRQVLTLSSVSLVVFPLGFFSSDAAREIVFDIRTDVDSIATHPVPLVMIVFDGMSGMSLLNQDHDIDSVRYPNFASLSKTSTWFRNASTVHLRTDHALPAILSSGLPEESFLPIESHYPRNLFRLIHESNQYEMTVFEPYIRMSPEELCHYDYHRTFADELYELTNVSWRLYMNITFPRELPNPEIPKAWFGMSSRGAERQKYMKGQIVYSWDQHRATQVDHFIDSIRQTSKPGFYFLHLALPHYPWSMLPDGRSYLDDDITICAPGLIDETWCDDDWPVQLCWQRSLLQIQYADRVLGQILDKLKQLEMFDKAMLVVTSDHGMSFHAGESLRGLSDATSPDLLCVPLFVKQPAQRTGQVNDASVETIDILPTIAETLGLSSDPEWDGSSVFSSPPRLRKTIAGPQPAIMNAEFPERFRHVTELTRVFGSSGPDDRLGRLTLIPDQIGRSVEVMRAEASAFECTVSRGVAAPTSPNARVHPCFLIGRLQSSTALQTPVVIAVSVNGKLAVATRTSPKDDEGRRWTAMIPPDLVNQTAVIELFEVRRKGENYSLHQIREIPIDSQAADSGRPRFGVRR
ncbi:MAG: sulfatase-like hydrolase/transferase [Planctomycetota bacterium]